MRLNPRAPITQILCLLALLGTSSAAQAQDAEAAGEAQLLNGLTLFLAPGGAENFCDVRQSRLPSLRVAEGEPASPFMEPGPFRALWRGKLLLDRRSRLYFTLEGTGDARLLIDGEEVVSGMGNTSERIRLSGGERELELHYTSPAEGEARVRLLWEGREFLREPIPASALRSDPAEEMLARSILARHGRFLLAERHCVKCHAADGLEAGRAMPELSEWAPSLDGIGSRVHTSWLKDWIENPQDNRTHAHMPKPFRENAEEKAAVLAQYLSTLKEEEALPEPPAGDIGAGGHLIHALGCVGCHSFDDATEAGRVSLADVGLKYKPGALVAFLLDPARNHASTRMPDFKLTRSEAGDIAAYLRGLSEEEPAEPPINEGLDADYAKNLFQASGCVDCHQVPGHESTVSAPALADLVAACFPAEGCLAGGEGDAPLFELSEAELLALRAFASHPAALDSLKRANHAEYTVRQYEALRCQACHTRDGQPAFREIFGDEVAALEPPADPNAPGHRNVVPELDYLEYKLQEDWLRELLSADLDYKVRPWIEARMPGFHDRADLLARGFADMGGVSGESMPETEAPEDAVQVGDTLAGLQGLNCRTCHAIGEMPAIAVFEGAGPNLWIAPERLRYEYYQIWMHDPQRFIPATIMPKYPINGRTPFTTHYEGDAEKQFRAIWEYLRQVEKPSGEAAEAHE